MTARRMVWQFIEARDHRVMRRVNRWRAPRWLRVWMVWSTRLGDGWIWYTVGITLLLFGGDLRFIAFAASASAELATVVLFRAMKKASHRKRPCHLEAHCWSNVLPPDQFSFLLFRGSYWACTSSVTLSWVRCWEPGWATELTSFSGKSGRGILQFSEFNTKHTEKSHREH